MKTNFLLRVILFVIVAGLLSLSCSPTGISSVTIRINLGLDNKAAFNNPGNSIIDRAFCFFAKEAQAAPSNIASLLLNVTGPGMEAIHQSYTSPNIPDSVTLEVASGSSRLFEVIAYVNPSTPSAALSYRGVATQDLTSGATVDIPIRMALYETKIVIPDYQNQRIVQIDNMTVPNWQQRLGSNISYTGTFRPQDVDFDSQGRIFIANDTPGSAGEYIILRVDDITAITFTPIIPGNATGLDAMAIDRNNNYIHYSVTNGVIVYLYRTNLDGAGSSLTNMSASIKSLRGMAVDSQGLLYIAGTTNPSGLPAIFVCNPTNPAPPYHVIINSVTNATITSLSTPYHVLIKSPYLYVVNPSTSGSNNQILQLNMSTLQLIQGYGNYSLVSTTQGNFYGPRHFVAVLNRKITLIDEGPDNTETSKLISMDDINGTNWEPFGSYGTGTNQFNFYFYC